MANPGPSNAESGAAVPKIVYTKSFLDLADLTFSDPETRTLSRPLPVKSKKELCRIVALGRYKPYNLEFPIGFKSCVVVSDTRTEAALTRRAFQRIYLL